MCAQTIGATAAPPATAGAAAWCAPGRAPRGGGADGDGTLRPPKAERAPYEMRSMSSADTSRSSERTPSLSTHPEPSSASDTCGKKGRGMSGRGGV